MSRNNASPAYQRQIARDESDARLRAMLESAGASTGPSFFSRFSEEMSQLLDHATEPARSLATTILSNAGHALVYSRVAASAVATEVYQSAAGVTFEDVAEHTRDLASAIGSSAANTVGSAANTVVTVATVCTDAVVTPILEFSNSIQEELVASLYPTRLKNVIPNDHDCGANYTSDVIESLKKYNGAKEFKVEKFAHFVAQKIIEELKKLKDRRLSPIDGYNDLLSTHCIEKIYELSATDKPLNIKQLKRDFINENKNNQQLLNSIPSQKENFTARELEKKRLEKERYEYENSPEHLLDLLKDVIPGNDKWGANYTSDVIESLETYELLKHFKVKNFAQFVARKIMEELKHDEGKDGKCGVNGIYKYKDLLSSQHYINKISKLKRGPLDIDTLKDEFKIKCKGDEALLNTIPSEKEKPPLSPAGTAYIAGIKERARTPKTTPKTTIFGVTFTCCVARDGKTR